MPIIFISLSETYSEKIKQHGFESKTMKIQDYVPKPNKKTYYVSPANSLCFMDGGIDYALSRIIFPNIEVEVKTIVKQLGITSIVGKPYLPIGSSIILNKGDKSLVVSPTMLLPQNVSNTQNAYYATMSVLYNILINQKENIEDIDIIFTSFCCGYGKMDEDVSILQIMDGIKNYIYYEPKTIHKNIILNEPNLYDQPKYYQNTEFFTIKPEKIINC
uniref:Macro domain-containing protein n=1 Tax=viral metagenome TaxID=1070528 RepID=A0A6C0EPI7_9ZZZZ